MTAENWAAINIKLIRSMRPKEMIYQIIIICHTRPDAAANRKVSSRQTIASFMALCGDIT